MGKFAVGTKVSAEKTRVDIEKLVAKYGAKQFVSGFDHTPGQERAVIEFAISDRRVRFRLPLSAANKFMFNARGIRRTDSQRQQAWEADTRQRWRALLLVIKAKLEAVEQKIVTFDEEFMAQIVMPNGNTVGDEAGPRIAEIYKTKIMTPLLSWAGANKDER